MSRLDSKRLEEAIAGLPTTMDPYAPAMRQDVRMASTSKPAGPDEVPPPEKAGSTPQPIEQAASTAPGAAGTAVPPGGVIPPPPKPDHPVWEKFPLPNKKDLGFRRSDGFFLRIRKIDSVPGKYLAQLWSGNKILDKGPVFVPQGENVIKHIQGMADSMLDDNSQRYEQTKPEIPEVPEGEQPGLTAPEEPQPEQEQLTEPTPGTPGTPKETPGEEEIAFDDEDFEITDEDLPRP